MLRRCVVVLFTQRPREESQQQAQAAAEQLLANEKDQTAALEPWSLERGGHSSAGTGSSQVLFLLTVLTIQLHLYGSGNSLTNEAM
jgi:hypothetical protein